MSSRLEEVACHLPASPPARYHASFPGVRSRDLPWEGRLPDCHLRASRMFVPRAAHKPAASPNTISPAADVAEGTSCSSCKLGPVASRATVTPVGGRAGPLAGAAPS